MTTRFDSLGYAHRLEQAGVSKEQASVHAEALRDVRESQECLEQHVQLIGIELCRSVDPLGAELRAAFADLRMDVRDVMWMAAINIGLTLIILIKLSAQ